MENPYRKPSQRITAEEAVEALVCLALDQLEEVYKKIREAIREQKCYVHVKDLSSGSIFSLRRDGYLIYCTDNTYRIIWEPKS